MSSDFRESDESSSTTTTFLATSAIASLRTIHFPLFLGHSSDDSSGSCGHSGHGKRQGVRLLKFEDVPRYLQFNQYVLHGYRPPNMSYLDSLKSLLYFHNETVNIMTHVISVIIFGVFMPFLVPWDQVKHPILAWSMVIGSVSSWVGSSLYHLLMNHEKGEKFYTLLLQFDVTGIWVTQAIGAATTIYTSVYSYDDWVRWTFIVVYSILAIGSLRDSLLARSAWSRILGFGSLFVLRIVAFFLRVRALDASQGEGSALIHVIMQEGWAFVGSFISATRVPERWFPGRFDYGFNSHNLMHVFVVLGAFHMHAAATSDLLWLAKVDGTGSGGQEIASQSIY